MKFFYKIWIDTILFEKSKNLNDNSWKGFSLSIMSLLLGINIATVYAIFILFGIDVITFVWMKLSFIENSAIKNVCWSILMMFIPAFFINYFLVFYNNRFYALMVKYQPAGTKKGGLLRRYFIVTFLVFFGINLLKKLISN